MPSRPVSCVLLEKYPVQGFRRRLMGVWGKNQKASHHPQDKREQKILSKQQKRDGKKKKATRGVVTLDIVPRGLES